MLGCFFPADQREAYRASPHKSRIDLIGQRLVQLRYLPAAIAQHVREWLRLTAYLQRRRIALPRDVSGPAVGAYVTHRLRTCRSASRVRFVRASVRIFLEADDEGAFSQRTRRVPRPVPPWLAPAVSQYVAFLRDHRGAAVRTVAKRVWQLARFGEWAERAGARSLVMITPGLVRGFLVQLRGQAVVTRITYVSTLRSFVGWAYMAGLLSVDLRPAVIAPRRFKQRGIRDVLSDHDVTRILAAVDRSSAIGRRDYAVLMLAARYGLRPADIRQLSVDAIAWREGILSIRQTKTGRLLTLPLLPEVAQALIAYLRDGRPATESRHVFVRHRAPVEPFSATNNLAGIMRRALQRAGLDRRSGRRGLYLFRHTLANRLLAAGCALKSIGDVLGHASTAATMEYASIDLAALRRVAISETEVRA